MQNEIVEITERCRLCGTATALLMHSRGITYGGDQWAGYWSDRPEHTRKDCERVITLSREQWPTLW